jgi:hypothetical protein
VQLSLGDLNKITTEHEHGLRHITLGQTRQRIGIANPKLTLYELIVPGQTYNLLDAARQRLIGVAIERSMQ